jgi:hypothetical protein
MRTVAKTKISVCPKRLTICEIDDRNDCWETKESISSAAAAEFNKKLNIDGVV